MKLMGFHHVQIKCADLDATIKFYEALGMVVERSWGEGDRRACLMHLGNGNYMELCAGGVDGEKADGFVAHIAIRVDDTKAAFEAALAAGAVEARPVTRLDIQSTPEIIPVTLAFVKGPDGVVIEFFQIM